MKYLKSIYNYKNRAKVYVIADTDNDSTERMSYEDLVTQVKNGADIRGCMLDSNGQVYCHKLRPADFSDMSQFGAKVMVDYNVWGMITKYKGASDVNIACKGEEIAHIALPKTENPPCAWEIERDRLSRAVNLIASYYKSGKTLFTLKETAQILGVSPYTVLSYYRSGKMKSSIVSNKPSSFLEQGEVFTIVDIYNRVSAEVNEFRKIKLYTQESMFEILSHKWGMPKSAFDYILHFVQPEYVMQNLEKKYTDKQLQDVEYLYSVSVSAHVKWDKR